MTKVSLRFDVFNRDGFTCQYCGRKPPEVILEVDHIIAKAKGGGEEIENLITACYDCNRGKSAKKIGKSTPRIKKNLEELKEREKQMIEYYQYQQRMQGFVENQILGINTFWEDLWNHEYSLNERGRMSVKMFLKKFTEEEIKEAMYLAAQRVNDVGGAFKYMCGILHHKYKEREDASAFGF